MRNWLIDSWVRWASWWTDGDDQQGQGMVEYALILVFVAVTCILVITRIGHGVNNVFSNVSNGLSS